MKNEIKNHSTVKKGEIERKIEIIAWGLFFIWIGIAFLAGLSNGIGLLGVGIITLGGQAVRNYYNLKLELFWVIVGACFVLGGLWEFLDPGLSLVPILLIIAGCAILYSGWNKSLLKNKRNKKN